MRSFPSASFTASAAMNWINWSVLLNFRPEASLRRVKRNKTTPKASRARTTTVDDFTSPPDLSRLFVFHGIVQRVKGEEACKYECHVYRFTAEKKRCLLTNSIHLAV